MFTLLKSTLQAGDEDSPELTDENEDIEVAETPLQMERSRLASPLHSMWMQPICTTSASIASLRSTYMPLPLN